MVDDAVLHAALKRHWEYAGKDEDVSHEIYHDDAVLEFPQSGERFEGVENFREWRRQYPAKLDFKIRRVIHGEDLVVAAEPAHRQWPECHQPQCRYRPGG